MANKKKKKSIFYIILVTFIIIELGTIVGILAYNYAMFEFLKPRHVYKATDNKKASKSSHISNITSSKPSTSSLPETDNLAPVDSSYFDDALFIGDSRTVGLRAFGTFYNSSFFAKTGISVNSFFTYPALDEETSLTLTQTLFQRQYGKIYIMIGVNDVCAVSLEDFSEQFFAAVSRIQELQPNAIIYVQSILGVTKNRELSEPKYFNNSYVLERNALLKSKCDGEKLIYLDVFSVFADSEGYLSSDLSSDGLHLKGTEYGAWCEYLLTHAKKE